MSKTTVRSKARKLLARTALSTTLLLPAAGCEPSFAGVERSREACAEQISAQDASAQVTRADANPAEAPLAAEQVIDRVQIGNGKMSCYAEPSAQEIRQDASE